MRKAHILHQTEEYHSTYILPDLTSEQQRNGKLLRDEMKLHTNRGEANLWIQRGKWWCEREKVPCKYMHTTKPCLHDSNHVNNLNETLYNVNSLDETLHNVNSLNETLLNESKLQRQNNPNTWGQLADSLVKVCNVNKSHIEHTVQNKKLKSDTSNKPNAIKKNRLICLYMNARSIVNKMTALEASIIEYDPDVIGITESWTTENHIQSELQLPSFPVYNPHFFPADFTSKRGCVLFIHRNINCKTFYWHFFLSC